MKDKKNLISHKKCSLQYVGKMENVLYIRMSETTLTQEQGRQKNQLRPTGSHHEGPASEGDRGDPQEQHTVMKRERERERELLDLHPQNAVSTWVELVGLVMSLHMSSQCMPSQYTLAPRLLAATKSLGMRLCHCIGKGTKLHTQDIHN